MKLGLFLVSAGNRYQARQKDAATSAARAAGVELDVFLADGDAKKQRDQVFGYIRAEKGISGVIVHAVEEAGLRFVAQEAARKGLAWVMVNRAPAWVAELARAGSRLAFSVTVDQRGIGRLQGEQFRALLPAGGTVLYVMGPSMAGATQERQAGLDETKGSLLSVVSIVGDWSEAGASEAVSQWLQTTRGFVHVDMIGAQNDDMALGAGSALRQAAASLHMPEWLSLPLTGVDGLPDFGQRLVDDKALTATIVMPATTGTAVELLAAALRGGAPPPAVTTVPVASYPQLGLLRKGS